MAVVTKVLLLQLFKIMPGTIVASLVGRSASSGGSGTPSASGGVGPLKLVYQDGYDSNGYLISSDTTIVGTPKTIVLPDNPYEELRFYCYIRGGSIPKVAVNIIQVRGSWSKGAYANAIFGGIAHTSGVNARIAQSVGGGFANNNMECYNQLSTEDNLKVPIATMLMSFDSVGAILNYLPATRTLTLDPKVTRTSAQMADATLQTKLQMILVLGR